MARIGVRIEATEEGTEQKSSYENLPNGNYLLQMEACDVAEKNEGTPEHSITVKSTFEVLEPEDYKGRKLFGNYNIANKNETAQRIGNEQFQCLLRAMEMSEFGEDDDTDILRFVPFTATIGMGKDSKTKNADGSPEYPAKNEIKRYWFPDQGNAPVIGVTGPVKPANDNRPVQKAAAAPAAKPAGSKPWGKKAA